MKNKEKKNLKGRIYGDFAFEGRGKESFPTHRWREFVGKGGVAFWGDAGGGCTSRKKA